MSIGVDESYRYCCELARRTGSNFYYSFYVLPRAKREAMCAIYAFMRHSDDIADGAANPAWALEELKNWRADLERAFRGSETGLRRDGVASATQAERLRANGQP